MKTALAAIKFLQSLKIPEGPKAGETLKLAPFQKRFVNGALADGIDIGVLSIGRGNAKTALASGLALAALMGKIDRQPRREVVVAARTREQGRVAFDFVLGFIRSLPDAEQKQFSVRLAPRLEIEYNGDGGGHMIKILSSDAKNALGGAPTLAILDERGHWEREKGDALENALLSGLGKRGGRALIISTSGPDDGHPFSKWIDEPQEGVYRQEHRAPPGLPADDLKSLKIANPGAAHGIGSSVKWLQQQGRRAIDRGGAALTSFRLLNRNERVSSENRELLLDADQWLKCETANPPPRDGFVVLGLDLGGSASMSAAAFYWPQTGRLETLGTFPRLPSLLDRGTNDSVGDRYKEMHARGELTVLGEATVPPVEWLKQVLAHVEGQTVVAITADRYRQAEIGEAIDMAGIRAPIVWRGQGWRDGSEDVERFRRAAFDGKVLTVPSLLMRSALADAVCLRDPANNSKLAKGRSAGRIDAAAASILAVAEGARSTGRPAKSGGGFTWV